MLVKCHPSPVSLTVFPLNIPYTFLLLLLPPQKLLTFPVSNNIYFFHGLYHSKTFTPHQILLGHQIKEAEMGETCDTYEKKENAYRLLVG
jgi:hypothetical protein